MNLRQNQKGFTIVELLIVVVVIAILAAISIVAYTGITNRANRSAAMEAANAVKSVATTYQGANSGYPTLKSEFVSGGSDPIAKLPNDIEFTTDSDLSTRDSNDHPKKVVVTKFPATGTITGFRIDYYDYTESAVRSMEVGTGVASTGGAILPNNT